MSYDCCVRIERMANGYSVCVKDPAIVKANNKRGMGDGPCAPYKDPEREYIFKTVKEVNTFLEKNLDKALPAQVAEDSFESSFDKAAAAASKDKD
jgi:hypothetical protein